MIILPKRATALLFYALFIFVAELIAFYNIDLGSILLLLLYCFYIKSNYHVLYVAHCIILGFCAIILHNFLFYTFILFSV